MSPTSTPSPTSESTLSYAKGSTTEPLRDITLGQLLAEAATECPERIAIIAGASELSTRRQWSYAELYQEAQDAARAIALEFAPGERIAVWSPNIAEWIILEFASALAGTILVTVNPSYQPNEVAYVLTQSKSAGVFVLPEFRGNPMLKHLESIADQCSNLRKIIRFDQWDDFVARGRSSSKELPRVTPSDPTMIQYTSGTTGFPKGALLHHKGLVNNGTHAISQMGVREGSVWLTFMPLFHTGGCVLCVLGAVAKRATQIVVEQFEPGLILELIETYKANSFVGVPTMLIAMLEHPDFATRDLSSIQAIVSGGSTVPAALVERLENELKAPFMIVFGQTECSPVATMTLPDDTPLDKANTLGPPMPHVEVKIVDPESGAIVPYGQIGEFCTRGYHVMHSYYDMDEATNKAIDSDGWLHMGDLCAMDDRGYCTIQGRLKDMIIRGGENIYPREIEELLFRHPSVGEVAIVGLPDTRFGEIVGAFLRPVSDSQIDVGELTAYLRKHLSPQKTPSSWFEVDIFPLTGSGKIQKFILREQWEKGMHKLLDG